MARFEGIFLFGIHCVMPIWLDLQACYMAIGTSVSRGDLADLADLADLGDLVARVDHVS